MQVVSFPPETAALDSVEGVAQITGNDENVVLELLVDRKHLFPQEEGDSGSFQATSNNTIFTRNLWVLQISGVQLKVILIFTTNVDVA